MSAVFSANLSTCAQKIFVERLPELCHPHAQRTKRLQEALRRLGLSMGGKIGADVGSDHGINGSRDTILRLVHQSQQLAQSEPHVIGLDDWAWKRRMRYGTLICDLERGVPIDVLPDRTVETVSAWLKKHPTIDTISRDGSSEYASAIKKGAPQAREVSDRWHLVKNLAECVSVLLTSCLTQLRRAEVAAAASEEQVEQPRDQPVSHQRTRAVRHAQQTRAAERQARSEQISHLQKQGMKSAEIAAQVGMPERTVRHWLSPRGIPYSGPRKPRSSPLDPYKTYLLLRWQEGCQNGAQKDQRIEGKRLQRFTKGNLSLFGLLGTLGQLSFETLFFLRERNDQEPTQSSPGPFCVQSHLALFPLARRLESGGAGAPPSVEASQPGPGNGLSAGQRVSANGA
jgi:transposase